MSESRRCPPRHAVAASATPAAVLAAFWLGCIGPTRVGMLPPVGGSSPGVDPIRPIEQSIAPPDRDAAAAGALASEDSGLAQGQVALAALLQRLFAGSTAPIRFGVFGIFDENRPFGPPPQDALEPDARPAAAERARPRCANFLCGPIARPRRR